MAWTFGHSLLLILAVVGGAAVGWALRGRQATGRPPSGVDPVPTRADRPATTAPVPVPDTSADRSTAGIVTPPADTTAVPADTVTASADTAVRPETVDAPATPDRSDHTPGLPRTTDPDPDLPTPAPVAHTEPVDAPMQPVDTQAEPVTPQPGPAAGESEPVAARTEPTAPGTRPLPAPVAEAAQAEPATTEPTAVEPVETEPAAGSVPAGADPTAGQHETAVPAPRAAQDGPDDDFRRIQGIGPKIAAALQAAGIRTYRQLAEHDEAGLREVIRGAGLRAAPGLASWPQQARILADAPAEADRVFPAPTA